MHDAQIDDHPRKKKRRLSDVKNKKEATKTENIESEKEVGNGEILSTLSF